MNHALKQESKLLQHLLNKIEVLQKYNHYFTQILETEMAKHCEIVKFEKNCLIVIVDTSNWATQLRFQIPELMIKLKSYPGLENLSGIICKIRPRTISVNPSKSVKPMSKLSRKTSENIAKMAESIRDRRLKEILQKISRYFI